MVDVNKRVAETDIGDSSPDEDEIMDTDRNGWIYPIVEKEN